MKGVHDIVKRNKQKPPQNPNDLVADSKWQEWNNKSFMHACM